MSKRSNISDDESELNIEESSHKRARASTDQQVTAYQPQSQALTTVNLRNAALVLTEKANRTSSLTAPEMYLTGHEGAVYSIAFDPSGQHLCSGSIDKSILLWDVFGETKNYNVLHGHKNAVLQVQWYQADHILSCSADHTVAIWDATRGQRVRKFTEHTGIVNCCAALSPVDGQAAILASGSDDCTAILWDERSKRAASTMYHDYQVCAIALAPNGQQVFTGGIDNVIRRFDTRMIDGEPDLILPGHVDTVTGLSVDSTGTMLLSNSMDCSLRVWDIRAFATKSESRCKHILTGVHHGAEKLLLRCAWSRDNEFITAGSADRVVHLWDSNRFQEVCGWPGHKASVNEVVIHPTEPIIVSCSSDRQITLGEFTP